MAKRGVKPKFKVGICDTYNRCKHRKTCKNFKFAKRHRQRMLACGDFEPDIEQKNKNSEPPEPLW